MCHRSMFSAMIPTLADDAQAVTVQLDRPDNGAAFASDEQQLLSVVIASLPGLGAEDCTPIEPRGTRGDASNTVNKLYMENAPMPKLPAPTQSGSSSSGS